jgi:hypothetical protein
LDKEWLKVVGVKVAKTVYHIDVFLILANVIVINKKFVDE